jgi:hypothetical protein
VYSGVDLLQYTTNATFLSRLDSYFKGGGSVILVGDAVRLVENGTGRLNYGKTIIAQNATNGVTTPSSLIPSQWLFIRGAPFCCVDRSGGGSNTVVQSSLVATGAVVSQVSLFDGNDSSYCEVWSETAYYPSDAASLLDVRFQGSGQYVTNGSICYPTVYQDSVSQVTSNLMGYTTVGERKIFFLGSDSFFDIQSVSLQGNWHCSPPNSQTINCQITSDGVSAILGLVQMAIATQREWQNLLFNPVVTGRTYTPQFTTNLTIGIWSPLTSFTGPVTNGNQVTITDTNPIPPQEFYRIDISLP